MITVRMAHIPSPLLLLPLPLWEREGPIEDGRVRGRVRTDASMTDTVFLSGLPAVRPLTLTLSHKGRGSTILE
jgi:hypothetical protein